MAKSDIPTALAVTLAVANRHVSVTGGRRLPLIKGPAAEETVWSAGGTSQPSRGEQGVQLSEVNPTECGQAPTSVFDPKPIPRAGHCHSVTVRLALDQKRWVGTGRIRE
jgi:hypothetical protein